MSWTGLATNQMVSYTDAQGGGFTLNSGQSAVTSDQMMDKIAALTKYNLSSTSLSGYASNQLIPKGVWVSGIPQFISTWDTRNLSTGSSAANQIKLPLVNAAGTSYNFTVNWGDGQTSTITSGATQPVHTYTTPGIYTIYITGTITGWRFESAGVNPSDCNKILSIQNWGPLTLGSPTGKIGYNFLDCVNLDLSSVADVLILTGTAFPTTSLVGLFAVCTNLTTVNRINEWNTSTITNMSNVFYGCSKFISSVSNWGTNAVTNMSGMFYGCTLFNSSVSNWVTNLVTDMSYMFAFAISYNQPMIGSGNIWSTAAVLNMDHMFYSTNAFNQNLNTWNVAAVRNMSYMFAGASAFNNSLAAGVAGTLSWTTTALGTAGNGAVAMIFMFNNATKFNCSINSFNTANVTSLESTFENAALFNNGSSSILTFTTNIVTSLKRTFRNASAFNQQLLLSGNQWNTAALTNLESTFESATSFNNGGIPLTLTTNLVTTLYRTFYGAIAFNQNLTVSGNQWNTVAVTTMESTFELASSFNKPIGTWNTGAVINMAGMFDRATSFNCGQSDASGVLAWNTANVTNMSYMFAGATSFKCSVAGFNTSKVSQFSYMFQNATSFNQPLTYVAPNTWNVSNSLGSGIVWMKSMFDGATSFNGGFTSGATTGTLNWGESLVNTRDFSYMFRNASSFNCKLQNNAQSTNGWNTDLVYSMQSMFEGAAVFNQPLPSGVTFWRNPNVGSNNTAGPSGVPITGSFISMFKYAPAFNNGLTSGTTGTWSFSIPQGPLSISFSGMFYGATAFNQNISTWLTNRVTDTSYMFYGANLYNQPMPTAATNQWNTSIVTDMGYMFGGATSFNQPIATWNTAAVIFMNGMFLSAASFNQPLATSGNLWKTTNVQSMNNMFYNATLFNQNIGTWDIGGLVTNNIGNFMSTKTPATFSTANLDAIYSGWSARTSYSQNINFNTANYSAAGLVGRNTLKTLRGWSITDGGLTGPSLTTTNFDGDTYRDGTPIPEYTGTTGGWANLTTGAWCVYNNDILNGITYGKMYNWYAVMGIHNGPSLTNPALRKQIAPTGYHVPSDAEWATFTTYYGGTATAGGNMKSKDPAPLLPRWASPNTGATNYSEFDGLPGGYRDNFGAWNLLTYNGYYWSSTENPADTPTAWFRRLDYNSAAVTRNSFGKSLGMSVRFIKE